MVALREIMATERKHQETRGVEVVMLQRRKADCLKRWQSLVIPQLRKKKPAPALKADAGC